jgi:hypothetical protein
MRQSRSEIGRVDRECLVDGVDCVVKKRQSEQYGKSLPPGQTDCSVTLSEGNFSRRRLFVPQNFFQEVLENPGNF